MTDPLIASLEAVLADPNTRPSTRVKAIEQLAKLRGQGKDDSDPLGKMRAVVERWCPEDSEMRDVQADPMRDLDFMDATGRECDPLVLSWLPYCPLDAAKAERSLVAAIRRLGVGEGPYAVPERQDDLAARRHKKAS